jgi:exopolyphosphatase/guanosine-5'-triphosphate,3'-diphosphate pyrophosphatase
VRLGVLDIGSNTVHLLVVDAHKGGAPLPAVSHKAELRLSEQMDGDGGLRRGAVADLLAFVSGAKVMAEDLGVTGLMAFATSALRDARNGEAVLAEAAAELGADIALLTGEEEARLTFLAVRRWFGWSAGQLLVIDIGGGSLELAAGSDEVPDIALSVELGAGRLTHRFITHDPPAADEVRAMRRHARAEIGRIAGSVRRGGTPGKVVATSKTLRQLARIAGAAPSSEGPFVPRQLAREDVRGWVERLGGMTVDARCRLPGVSEGRARQLLAGAVVAEAAMDLLDVPLLELCPWALREGMILQRLDALQDSDVVGSADYPGRAG